MRTGELIRFAVGGLWRQRVRTVLTLVGVTVGTAALAFSLSLGFGLREFVDTQFKGRDEFWRIGVHPGEPAPDPTDIPPEKVEIKGAMSEERRARLKQALTDLYLAGLTRRSVKPLDAAAVKALRELPGVAEVRTYRTTNGRVWVGDKSAPALAVAGGFAGLKDRLIEGDLPVTPDGALVSELTLYELGIRDDADVAAAVGRPLRLEAGAVWMAKPLTLARLLTGGAALPETLTAGQSRALEKVAGELPHRLDAFGLSADERAGLKALLDRKPDPTAAKQGDVGTLVPADYRVAGVLRVVTREEQKRADPFAPWELFQGNVFLAAAAGDDHFARVPGADEAGYRTVSVRVTPGGDLAGTVAAIEGMGFTTFSSLKWFAAAKHEVTLIAAGLNLFALTALFVAGLGIANTLLTSVVERTREIGILKAVGATRSQVLGIFLLEGAVIGLLGSGLGLGLARGLVYPADAWVKRLIEQQMHGEKMLATSVFVFPWWLWAGAVGFAVVLTTAAAFYPARRAARIQPIEALRYE
jgi:putative ABC transport system permease protein